jgi:ribosome-associated protein
VNKVNTKVTLHWKLDASPSLPEDVRTRFRSKYQGRINKRGEVVIHSQRHRDQGRNVSDCITKLREMLLEVAAAPKRRRPTRPTRGGKERRLREKKARAQTKQLRRKPMAD